MQLALNKVLTVAFFATVTSVSCLAGDTLIGKWQSGVGHDNSIEYQITLEFAQDGSFHNSSAMKNAAGKVVTIPLAGTYKITDTNHVVVKVAFNSLVPSDKMSFNLVYSISNNVLFLQSFDETGHINKYNRIK